MLTTSNAMALQGRANARPLRAVAGLPPLQARRSLVIRAAGSGPGISDTNYPPRPLGQPGGPVTTGNTDLTGGPAGTGPAGPRTNLTGGPVGTGPSPRTDLGPNRPSSGGIPPLGGTGKRYYAHVRVINRSKLAAQGTPSHCRIPRVLISSTKSRLMCSRQGGSFPSVVESQTLLLKGLLQAAVAAVAPDAAVVLPKM
jgi:hypothetical protein